MPLIPFTGRSPPHAYVDVGAVLVLLVPGSFGAGEAGPQLLLIDLRHILDLAVVGTDEGSEDRVSKKTHATESSEDALAVDIPRSAERTKTHFIVASGCAQARRRLQLPHNQVPLR